MPEEPPNIDPQASNYLNQSMKAHLAWQLLRQEVTDMKPRYLSEWIHKMMDKVEAKVEQEGKTNWHEAYLNDKTRSDN